MKLKLISAITAFLICCSWSTQAQTLTFNDVQKVSARSTGTIVSGKEISGYYMLLFLDKIDKKQSLYKLIITDENFTKVSEKVFQDAASMTVMDASFNGNTLAIKFISRTGKEESQTIRFFDKEGKELPKKVFPYDFAATYMLHSLTPKDDLEALEIHPVPNVGFINFSAVETKGGMIKRAGVEMKLLPVQSTGYNSWTYRSPEKMIEQPSFLGANEEVAFISMKRYVKYNDKEPQFSIMGINIKTGKPNFDKEFVDDKYKMDVVSINPVSNSESILFGMIVEEDKKASKAKTLGMQVASIDNNGNIKNRHTFLWKDVAKDFNPTDEKGQPIDIGNVFIHKVVTTADGRMYAIGERFYKAASALGIASNILSAASGSSSSTSTVKLVVAELMILELSKDLKPISVEFIDKGKDNLQLPSGFGMLGTSALSYYAKAWGAFDLYFVQERNDREGFTVSYYSREKKVRYVNTISIYEGEKTVDKFVASEGATRYSIEPGKPGYIAVSEYFKKEKTLIYKLIRYKD
jgi:hypothetical protein